MVLVLKLFFLSDSIRFGIKKIGNEFVLEKIIGFSIKKIVYRKKYQIQYRKSIGFGIEKVSDLVSNKFGIKIWNSSSKQFGIGKMFRIRYCSDFGYLHTLHHGPATIRDGDFMKSFHITFTLL